MDIEQWVNARVTRHFNAPPQRVFDSWLDSKTAGKWLFATAMGQIIRVEIDARAGGWFYIVERRSSEDVEYMGEYVEMDRPHRLVFTLFDEKYSLEFERVTVEFTPHGTGCELSLSHETKPELAQQVSGDWVSILDGLAATLRESGGDPLRRSHARETAR
jgi:uncharacterized protein YndB with AHSA1/START domain